MNQPDLAKILIEDWPSLLAVPLAYWFSFSFASRPAPNLPKVKKRLGSRLDRYRDLSPEQLDTVLLTAVEQGRRDWQVRLVGALVIARLLLLLPYFPGRLPGVA